MSLRAANVLSAGCLLGVALACVTEPPVPGDETLGHFRFTASRIGEVGDGGCAFPELDGGARFAFEGTFSRFLNGTGAWFTVNGVSREGSWDGQVFASPYAAPRSFAVEACAAWNVEEALTVALLSDSQALALGNDCPEDTAPLLQPGGVPVDPDAGVIAPDSTLEGFDAARACGLLVEDISPAQPCDAGTCRLVYRVEGVRTR